ncbi:MAG: MutS2 family protein [Planctomycetota bacterium]|jgi:DNA mismatch repair protein MutS2
MEPAQFDLETLEFRVVRDLLTERLETALGRHGVQALQPLGSAEKANAALGEAAEIAARLAEEDRPPLGSAVELRSWLPAFFAGEHQPETRDIADLKRLLRCSLSCKAWLRAREGQSALQEMSSAFPDVRDMYEELENVVDDRGEVLSSASLRLGELRKEIDAAESAVRAEAARYAAREDLRRCLQTSEPSWRHGRPVLQVRQEFRHMVAGILHDRSQSGATLFIEPSCIVDLANRLSDARAAEHREIQVVLAQICRGLGRCREEIEISTKAIERLDLAQARAKLIHLDGYFPAPVVTAGGLRLRRALHPILVASQEEGDLLVPLDITLGEPYRMVVVTGPNTGGKTVVLKTVGLLALMALSGIPIPAREGSQIPELDGITCRPSLRM